MPRLRRLGYEHTNPMFGKTRRREAPSDEKPGKRFILRFAESAYTICSEFYDVKNLISHLSIKGRLPQLISRLSIPIGEMKALATRPPAIVIRLSPPTSATCSTARHDAVMRTLITAIGDLKGKSGGSRSTSVGSWPQRAEITGIAIFPSCRSQSNSWDDTLGHYSHRFGIVLPGRSLPLQHRRRVVL